MKRWLVILAVVLVVGIAGTAALVAVLVDGEAVRGLAVERATDALGRPVEVGELDVVFFPAPAVRVAALRVAGDAGQADLLEAEEVRLRIALWPLLRGRVEIAALDLESPVVRLPVGPDGLPRVPELPAEREPEAGETAPAPPGEASGEEAGKTITLAIDAFRLEGGRLEAGAWTIDDLQVAGALDLEGESRFTGSLELPDVGAIRDIEVVLRDLSADPEVMLSARLDDLALEPLAQRARLVPDPLTALAGTLAGSVEARVRGGAVEASSGDLTLTRLELVSGETRVAGDVPVRFTLGGPLEIDLSGAEVVSPPVTKPPGERLVVAGELGRELSPAVLEKLRLGIGPNDIDVVPDLARRAARIEPGRIELGPIASWIDLGEKAPAGAVAIVEPLDVTLEPLRVKGKLRLDGVRYSLEQGEARLDGPVLAQGERIQFQELVAQVGDQPLRLTGGYVLGANQVELDVGVAEAQVQPLIAALTGKSNLLGVLQAQVDLRGTPSLEGIAGSGRFSISPGEIQGFSLLRQILGPLGQAAEQVLAARGKDLSRYQEERFERLAGEFALARGQLDIRSLALEYRYGRADLRGSLRLADGSLALRGRVTLAPAVASDVLRTETDQPLELADVPIGCTIDAPCVKLDTRTLAGVITRVAARRAVGSRLQEKLEEKLGNKEDAEAIRGVLEGILGGGRNEK